MAEHSKSARSREADRYKKVATNALKMLDWCIWYFGHEGQSEIAKRLEQNSAHIRERLIDEPDPTLPAERGTSPQANVPVRPLRKVLKAIGLEPKPQN
jgi:hypothetical protein